MRLAVRHTTRYRFERPIVHAIQRLRLTPKSTQGQEIVEWSMSFENAEKQFEYEDQHRNLTTLIAMTPGAREVTVTCAGMIDTHDHAGIIGRHAGHLPLWSFRGQTTLTRPGPLMRALAREFRRTGPGTLEMLHALSARILEKVAYGAGATGVDSSGEEALAAGQGVCQDHAHIFIGTARALGIPARYVSGYLMMNDRIDQEASHAWAEAHVENLGWVGFDISNGISPDQRYVRVATGRDYRDAAPITGVSIGSANEDLTVTVAVEHKPMQRQAQQQAGGSQQ
jgi:transglutaminase-like putative cysteine protease